MAVVRAVLVSPAPKTDCLFQAISLGSKMIPKLIAHFATPSASTSLTFLTICSTPMQPQIQAQVQQLRQQAASLLVYQGVLENPTGRAFLYLLELLEAPVANGMATLWAYGQWFSKLAAESCSWQAFLLKQILTAENPFSQQAQRMALSELAPGLVAAAWHDLRALQQLYHCQAQQIGAWVEAIAHLENSPVIWQDKATNGQDSPHPPIWDKLANAEDWATVLEALAAHYRQAGTGDFATYRAFRWVKGELRAIAHPDPIQLQELVGYEGQRDILRQNTHALLAGLPSLNVLLYGSRGTGKSSLVKSLLNEMGDQGLRLIEVPKADLGQLPEVIERLRGLPQKFIIFVDDLSFEEDDDAFKSLKVVLEGSLSARPRNVVIYATSNRRHLVREFFGDRPRPNDADEISSWDTVQEKLSFSDRFGLTLTFEPPDQDTYLAIVRHLAQRANLTLAPHELEFRALQWATRHNGRSGRTARQFVDFVQAEQALKECGISY